MPTVVDLGEQLKRASPGSFDDKDSAELGRAFKKTYPGQFSSYADVPKKDFRNTIVDWTPAAGNIAGSIVGGIAGAAMTPEAGGAGAFPGKVIGGGLGQAAGGAVQPLERKAMGMPPGPPSSPLSDMAWGAGSTLVGEGVPKVAGNVAMSLALRSNPEIAATALREGITPTMAGMKLLMKKIGLSDKVAEGIINGVSKGTKATGIDELSKASGLTQDEIGQLTRGEPIVGRAGTKGLSYRARDISSFALKNIADQHAASPEGLPPQFIKWTNNMEAQWPGRMSAMDAWKQKKWADSAIKDLYNVPFGTQISPLSKMKAQWLQQISNTWRAILHNDVPTLGAIDKNTSALAALKDVMQPLVPETGKATHGLALAKEIGTRAAPIGVGASVGAYYNPNHAQGAILGGAAGAALSNPLIMAQLAHTINNPVLRQLFMRGTQIGGSFAAAPSDQPQ